MAFTSNVIDRFIDTVDCCPWASLAGAARAHPEADGPGERSSGAPAPIYTPEERLRRDSSPWTLVQGILAPVQFAIFLVSLWLVVGYLVTGEGFLAATLSVVAKTLALYAIMITGMIWERAVFGRYLFARPFFWEDVVSMLVLALHSAYLVALIGGYGDARGQMLLALAAYAAYLLNAAQFLLKLRAARLEGARQAPGLLGSPS